MPFHGPGEERAKFFLALVFPMSGRAFFFSFIHGFFFFLSLCLYDVDQQRQLGLLFIALLLWALRRVPPRKVDRVFRIAQLGSAAAYSLGHGTNDAQKTMGIIAMLLFSTGHLGAEFVRGVS